MVVMDPIADMLVRMRNTMMRAGEEVEMPLSKIKVEIAKVLLEEGFISRYEVLGKKILKIKFKTWGDNKNAIINLKRVSTPGRRVYKRADEIRTPLSGFGLSIISTSKGVLADYKARELKVGGEVLCHVW